MAQHRAKAKATQLCASGILLLHSVHLSAVWNLALLGQGRTRRHISGAAALAPTATIIITVVIIILRQDPTQLITLNS